MNEHIEKIRESRLRAYDASPGDIREHFGIEQIVLAGGYGYRQLLELVQNAADAILEAYESDSISDNRCRIEVLLSDSFLCVANTGAPFSEEGIDALLRSHSSTKRGNQIGRFGLGFKSLLRLGGKIEITSGSFAFSFDPDRCRSELKKRYSVEDAPSLRLAWQLEENRATELRKMFPWATTVVCSEIRIDNFHNHLNDEINRFPAEFLLFLPVSVHLMLSDHLSSTQRELHRTNEGHDIVLHDGKTENTWKVVERLIRITDPKSKNDATHVHGRDEVPIAWAVPIKGKREEAGQFWAFFPTHTPTYLTGILNAPWKLNSDRNAIIPGEWNTALMKEAAKLIADTLPQLKMDYDPGCILDAFPRQLDRTDDHAAPLVESLWFELQRISVIPNGIGELCLAKDLWRHPCDNPEIAKLWQELADENQLRNLVHYSCLEKQRASRLRALFEHIKAEAENETDEELDEENETFKRDPFCPKLMKREVTDWFSAVATIDQKKAVQVLKLAESYEKDCKRNDWLEIRPKIKIIPSDDGKLLSSSQAVFSPEGTRLPGDRHPVANWIDNNEEAKRILIEILKVKPLDANVWKEILSESLKKVYHWHYDGGQGWSSLWGLLRSAPIETVKEFIKSNSEKIYIKRRDGEWVTADDILLPGKLISNDDKTSNQKLLVDMEVHEIGRASCRERVEI